MTVANVSDSHIWSVTYDGGADFSEYDHDKSDTVGRGFAEVEKDRVKVLTILPVAKDCMPHTVQIPDGATPVFFRRRSVAINLTDERTSHQPTVHCIGWKRGDEAVYLFVFDDGSTLLTDNHQAV